MIDLSEDRLLTIKEVAAYLHVTRQHAWAYTIPSLVVGAVLPSIRMGPRSLRVRASDLEAWLERRHAEQSEGGRQWRQ